MEVQLTQPVNIDGVSYGKLTVASLDAIVKFRSNSAEQTIVSLARVFGLPRRVIRHLHSDDAHRAGDLIVALLDEATRGIRHFGN